MIEKPNELVKRSLDTAMEDAGGRETGSPSHDMERSLGVEGDGHEHEAEIQELQMEDRGCSQELQYDFYSLTVINVPKLLALID
ncbi:hypothetical protein EZV62_008980 [Acer yangbiense]|uniref:Uncharacterized protein n=1 Tax=Acer yangbiense TaxID=1000413 RepID=A0A5C7IFC1_9ROSI|nr:hypothetical protein EZV62_008980 [Acer yangbiense]